MSGEDVPPGNEPLRMGIVGDVMLGRGVNAELRAGLSPEALWGDLLPELRGVDLLLGNLECAITTHDRPWERTPKVFHFRADPDMGIAALRAAGFDWVSLANNHTLDYEEEGLLETLAHLDAAGIAYSGAGPDAESAAHPAILTARDWRVAVVAVTDNEPEWVAGPATPGTRYLPVTTDPHVLAHVDEVLSVARDAGVDLVVFSNHWGPNMVAVPPPRHIEFVRAVIGRGADLYYGHSAHLFQGVEAWGGGLILYDTGDFLDDYAVDADLRNDWSFFFEVTFHPDGEARLRMVPVRLHYAQVMRARGEEAAAIRERMRRRAAPLGTTFEEEGEDLVLRFSWRGRRTAPAAQGG